MVEVSSCWLFWLVTAPLCVQTLSLLLLWSTQVSLLKNKNIRLYFYTCIPHCLSRPTCSILHHGFHCFHKNWAVEPFLASFCYGTYLRGYNELFLLLWIPGVYSSRCWVNSSLTLPVRLMFNTLYLCCIYTFVQYTCFM